MICTVLKTKEYPPEEYLHFHPEEIANTEVKKSFFKELIDNLVHMPSTMKQLAVVQFFTWFAFFSMWVFTTPSVASHVFDIAEGDTTSASYNNAANWVGILFGVYNAVSAVYALLLPKLLKVIKRKNLHAFSLSMGGVGLISLLFIDNQYVLILPMIGIGLAWGSALAIPYAILSGSIPASNIGVYMGIFNFTITAPQILNGIFGGLIVKYLFNEDPVYALVMAGAFLLLGALASIYIVKDTKVSI